MATHAHANPTLPHPSQASASLSARERYTTSTPAFKRSMHQQPRSPTYCGNNIRRHDMSPLSSVPAANAGASNTRTDRLANTNGTQPPATPPLMELQTQGTIMADGITIKPDILGTIDKGFFLSDRDWTCYRRNYFSTICSFTLSPLPQTTNITFCPTKTAPDQYHVYGWAMSISAVVSENLSHEIELVQHTPKRDKGPTHQPEKVAMQPKIINNQHPSLNVYADAGVRASYADAYGGAAQQTSPVTEHSFERIQFKQATQNNGKRRAAQQYYHLVVELFADVGNQAKERFLKVAFRKSAQMIVRGRSPGHYSTDRRGSQSSGANNQNMAPYQVMTDYTPNPLMVTPGTFTATYDGRTHAQSGIRHNEVPVEHPLTADDEKAIDSAHRYLYFADAGMNATQNDNSGSRMHTGSDHKIKPEYEYSSMSRHFNPTSLSTDRPRCGPFEGKTTSSGYYQNMMSQPGVNFSGCV